MDEDAIPEFPDARARACDDDGKPPIIVSTNYYGDLECTRCGFSDGDNRCTQIFARQISTGRTAPIWKIDEAVARRIVQAFEGEA